MTTPSRADLLAALAEEKPDFQNDARVLDTANPLTAILDEIDATVLPAALTFDADGKTLTLMVSGRRLHRMTDGAPASLRDRPLTVEDTALTEQAARALEAFAADVIALTVAHIAPPEGLDMSDRVSVDALATALGRDAEDSDLPPEQRFLTRLGDAVTAVIHLDNRVAGEMTGSPADLAGLRIVMTTQVSAFLDARSDQCASHSDPSLTILADAIAPGVSVGLAVFDTHSILFSIASDALPRASDVFRRLI